MRPYSAAARHEFYSAKPSKACGVTGSMTSSNLVGPGSIPGGPAVAGRSERVIFGREAKRLRFESARPFAFHDRDERTTHMLRAGADPVIA